MKEIAGGVPIAVLARPGGRLSGSGGTFRRGFPQVFPKTTEINISHLLKRRLFEDIPPERLNRGLSRPCRAGGRLTNPLRNPRGKRRET
jgi:hypothetical protein